jgi:hypothetical protein
MVNGPIRPMDDRPGLWQRLFGSRSDRGLRIR